MKKIATVFSCLMAVAMVFSLMAPTLSVQAQDGGSLDNSGSSTETAPVESAGVTASVIYPDGMEIIPDNYIVVYKSSFSAASADGIIKASVAANGGVVSFIYGAALNGFAAYLPEKALKAVLADPNVDYVEADGIVELDSTPQNKNSSANESNFLSGQTTLTSQWNLDRIDQRILPLDNAYSYQYTGSGVNVYLIDTGVRTTHTEFGGRATKDYDAVGDGQNGNDCNGNGTYQAGLIGGTTFGVAKAVKIHSVRVYGCANQTSTSKIISGFNWVASHAIKPAVINFASSMDPYAPLDTAVKNLLTKGIPVVVSAGNSNVDACSLSPARVADVLTVSATNELDWRFERANFGTCVDIFAPGDNITSAFNSSDTDTNRFSGSSTAVPQVTGVVALFLQQNKTASVTTVVNAIKSFATTNRVQQAGTGSPNRLLYSLVNKESSVLTTLVSPSGTITDTTPAFSWQRVNSATKYQLIVYKGSTIVVNKTFDTTICSGYVCNYNQPTAFTLGSYSWKVRMLIGTTWTAYSSVKKYALVAGGAAFTSPFTSDASGWSWVAGTWTVGSGLYRGYGSGGDCLISAKHTGIYSSVDYVVKMKREMDFLNYVIVRGTPTNIDPEKGCMWNSAYLFGYSNDGWYYVYRVINGKTVEVATGKTTYVNSENWNTIHVKMQGSILKFYINGHLIVYGNAPGIESGQVGIGMDSIGYPDDILYVDSASLATVFTMSENEDKTGAIEITDLH